MAGNRLCCYLVGSLNSLTIRTEPHEEGETAQSEYDLVCESISNVDNAHKLQGKLLLILGELDTKVDPASTMQVSTL